MFGIRTLLLEGDREINGTCQREALTDELSLVVAPVAASTEGHPLFAGSLLWDFQFTQACLLSGGTLWLRYQKA